MNTVASTGSLGASAEFEALKLQKERREKEPLLLCKWITKWPVKSFLITLGMHITMLLITIILIGAKYEIFPMYFDDLPFRITHEPWDARHYAWNDRGQYAETYQRSGRNSGFRTSREWYSSLDLIYVGGSNNVFTKAAFKEIQAIENELVAAKDFQEKYCQINPVTMNCTVPNSLMRYFDGSLSAISATFDDPDFDNIPAVMYEALTNNATKQAFKYYLCNDYVITPTTAHCSLTRSVITFGKPHEDYPNNEDYKTHISEYSGEAFVPILEKHVDSNSFTLYYRSGALWGFAASEQAFKDIIWVAGSITFIFTVILLHTRSLWIAGLSIFSVLMSFVTGNLIYNVVYGYVYLGFFHILAIFIVLGIGADDIFVFYDIWRNSGCEEYPSLAHRLSDVYKRSALSMLFTSLTTCVAFLSSAIIPLLATRSFGLFAATVVVVNYISVIVYFPTVIIMFHNYIEQKRWPCYAPCRLIQSKCCKTEDGFDTHSEEMPKRAHTPGATTEKSNMSNGVASARHINPVYDASDVQDVEKQNYRNGNLAANGNARNGSPNGTANGIANGGKGAVNPGYVHDSADGAGHHHSSSKVNPADHEDGSRSKKSIPNRFFTNYYFRFVTHRYIRWVLLVAIAGLLGFFIYQATQINIYTDKPVSIFPANSNYPKALDYKLNHFVKSDNDENIEVYLIIGMNENDLSDCKFSQPVCQGKRQWDANFNPSTVEAQTAIQNLCRKLKTMTGDEAYELRLDVDPVTGENKVQCYIDDLKIFLDEESANTGKNWSLPFTRDKLLSFMDDRTTYYDSSALNSADFDDIIEVPISYWLYDRYSGEYTQDYIDYNTMIGESISSFSTPLKTDNDILYGNNMLYVGIMVELSVNYRTLSYREGIPIRTKWEEFFTGQLAAMPEGLREGFQVASPEVWSILTTKKMIVNNAIYGIVIGVSLACPILIIATRNVITGLLATLSLICCTTCVVGVIPLGGWSLGFLEGLNLCMIVGLSVDYVVHLAEGYSHSLHQDRLSRVRDMLDEMAVPIFFGACTTLGASSFMFLTKLLFFQQFGIFMFSTLGFSFVFSMGLFVILLSIIGPEGDTGNFVVFFKKHCKRRSDD